MNAINTIVTFLNNNGPAELDTICDACGCSQMDVDDAAGRICRAAVIEPCAAPAGQKGRWFQAL